MAKEYRHLSMQERALIETQLGFGVKPSAIALGLARRGCGTQIRSGCAWATRHTPASCKK